MEEWIGKLNTFLGFVKWNSALALTIQDYLNHTEFKSETVDGLIMGVTKVIETELRGAAARFTSAAVPQRRKILLRLLIL